MNEDIRKLFTIVLVLLEIVLAACFVFLAFLFGIWEKPEFPADTLLFDWILEGTKRQLLNHL
jgi:hypothetical protein